MHAFDCLKRLSKLPRPAVAAAFGDEESLRSLVISRLTRHLLGGKTVDFGSTRFDGDSASWADVHDELRTLPFLSKFRVVVVAGADGFVTKHRGALEHYVQSPSSSAGLLLELKTFPANTRLYKMIDSSGLVVDCKTPNDRMIVPWLIDWAREEHATALQLDAAQLLVELVGAEVGLLVSDVAKLSVYVGEKALIRREDVTKLVGAGRVETIWKTLNAATTGNAAQAIRDLDGLLSAGESPVGLLAAMSFSLRKVYHSGQLRKQRKELREACAEAGILPFAVEQTAQQHTHLGPGRVALLPEWLLQADLDVKGGAQLSPRVILERLLIRLARPRTD